MKKKKMKKLIDIIENKQLEIYTDIEDFEELLMENEDFTDGFLKGWLSAFDMVLLLIEENKNLF